MRHYSHAKAGPAISTQSRKERRVRKGATALESRKPTSAKDRLRRLAARSRRHGREQVPATSRSHAAHFVSFALPDTERASCPTQKRASPFTERYSAIPCRRTAPGFESTRSGASVSFGSGDDARIAGHGMAHDMLACRCDRPSPTVATATGRDKGFRVPREAQIFAAYALLAAKHYLKPLKFRSFWSLDSSLVIRRS